MRLAFFEIRNLNKKFEIIYVIAIIKLNKKRFLFIICYHEKTFFKDCVMTHRNDWDISNMSSKCTRNQQRYSNRGYIHSSKPDSKNQ